MEGRPLIPWSVHSSHGRPLVPWASTRPMGVRSSHGRPLVPWTSARPMGGHSSHGRPLVPWTSARPMGVRSSHGRPLVPWRGHSAHRGPAPAGRPAPAGWPAPAMEGPREDLRSKAELGPPLLRAALHRPLLSGHAGGNPTYELNNPVPSFVMNTVVGVRVVRGVAGGRWRCPRQRSWLPPAFPHMSPFPPFDKRVSGCYATSSKPENSHGARLNHGLRVFARQRGPSL